MGGDKRTEKSEKKDGLPERRRGRKKESEREGEVLTEEKEEWGRGSPGTRKDFKVTPLGFSWPCVAVLKVCVADMCCVAPHLEGKVWWVRVVRAPVCV